MKTATAEESNDLIVLNQALWTLKEKFPWAPIHALRDRVKRGEIPSQRSSDMKGARWYVRMRDLEAALNLKGTNA